jgi:flagellar basal body-associated protein FliL
MNEDESFNTGPSKGMLVAIIAGVAVLFIVAMLAAFFFFIKPRMFPAFDPATLPTEVQPAAPSSLAPTPAQ